MVNQHGGIYVGLMSGTSLDAVDAVALHMSPEGRAQVIAGESVELPAALRDELLKLNTPAQDELGRAALAARHLARVYAEAVQKVLGTAGLPTSKVVAIGAHGQTVRHRPDLGYTVQLNAPALLAELTGIDVIADFRSRDMAAGGQGAPLVPAFHAALFAGKGTRVVLNLGGIANITLLGADGSIRGFDTGPANMLMDAWIQRCLEQPYDADGAWATSGQCIEPLLECLLQENWFGLPPPKSTGRDDFNLTWLERKLSQAFGDDPQAWPDAADVQATLLQLTARSVASAICTHAADATEVLVCGGGSRNKALMAALRGALRCPVEVTGRYGLPAQWVEAAAFAWLAWCYEHRIPAGLPAVTGARHPRILGCKYLA